MKRILALLLIAGMLLSLGACSKNADPSAPEAPRQSLSGGGSAAVQVGNWKLVDIYEGDEHMDDETRQLM